VRRSRAGLQSLVIIMVMVDRFFASSLARFHPSWRVLFTIDRLASTLHYSVQSRHKICCSVFGGGDYTNAGSNSSYFEPKCIVSSRHWRAEKRTKLGRGRRRPNNKRPVASGDGHGWCLLGCFLAIIIITVLIIIVALLPGIVLLPNSTAKYL